MRRDRAECSARALDAAVFDNRADGEVDLGDRDLVPFTDLAERADLITTITSYYYEYMAQVITGQADLDATWADYLSNMDAMGASRLHEIDQAAYTRSLEG